jgi:hypothetical protein
VNELLLVLDAVAIILAALIAGIGFAAALRYRDRRFFFVGTALAVLGLVSGLGAVDVLWPGWVPDADLGTVPVLLLIVSEALVYLSFVTSRSWTSQPPNP